MKIWVRVVCHRTTEEIMKVVAGTMNEPGETAKRWTIEQTRQPEEDTAKVTENPKRK